MPDTGHLLGPSETTVLRHTAAASGAGTELRVVLPGNEITNGNFVNAGGWVAGAGWAIAAGVATGTVAAGNLTGTTALVAGTKYRVRYTLIDVTGGGLRAVCGAAVGLTRTVGAASPGTVYTEDIIADGSGFRFEDDGGVFSGNVDNVSVTEMVNAERRLQIVDLYAGYDTTAPSGSKLTVEWVRAGTAQTLTWYTPALGTALVTLPFGGIIADPDTLVTLTMTAGGGAVVGNVDVFYGGL